MKDILTTQEKRRLNKCGAVLVRKNIPWPLPPELASKYHLYHAVRSESPSRVKKIGKCIKIYYGPMNGERLVAIARRGNGLTELIDLVKNMPDWKDRKLVITVIWDPAISTGIF